MSVIQFNTRTPSIHVVLEFPSPRPTPDLLLTLGLSSFAPLVLNVQIRAITTSLLHACCCHYGIGNICVLLPLELPFLVKQASVAGKDPAPSAGSTLTAQGREKSRHLAAP